MKVKAVMAIDVTREKVISLEEAANFFPSAIGNGPVHVETVKRWIRRGLGGIRLEGCMSGNSLATSIEAVRRFNQALLDRRLGSESPERINQPINALSPAEQQAISELRAAGYGG